MQNVKLHWSLNSWSSSKKINYLSTQVVELIEQGKIIIFFIGSLLQQHVEETANMGKLVFKYKFDYYEKVFV
jgi:hypothetical protein